jgi:alkanesulfonate monooxygenase SsuD/methylene tetrahydromethanopterin reductase-like flavin-dependent oxidoreductase (luciferase family)
MQFSVWPNPSRSWDDLAATARHVDANGWHGVWFADHYMPNTADGSVADGPVQECWTVLPALGAITSRVRLGSLVSPTTVHHPALLANRAASLDHVSGGRAVLGMGAGWQVNEHRAYGFELPAPGPRVARFEEAIRVVRSLLDEPRTTFHGDSFDIDDAPCEPKPVQAKLPILVGTASPRMLRITARHADEWNTWGDLPTATARRELFLAACDAVGRDPATVRTSVQALTFLGDDPAELAARREHALPDRSIFGTPAELVETLGRYAELGFDEFILPDWNLGRELAERLDALDRFQVDVAAHLH